MTTGTLTAAELGRLALDSHRSRRGLEPDMETVLVHLLADLIEWCDYEHVDLDASISQAREMLRDCAEEPNKFYSKAAGAWVDLNKS